MHQDMPQCGDDADTLGTRGKWQSNARTQGPHCSLIESALPLQRCSTANISCPRRQHLPSVLRASLAPPRRLPSVSRASYHGHAGPVGREQRQAARPHPSVAISSFSFLFPTIDVRSSLLHCAHAAGVLPSFVDAMETGNAVESRKKVGEVSSPVLSPVYTRSRITAVSGRTATTMTFLHSDFAMSGSKCGRRLHHVAATSRHTKNLSPRQSRRIARANGPTLPRRCTRRQ